MRRLVFRLSGLLAALVAALLAHLLVGAAGIPPLAALRALAGEGDPTAVTILRELRLPRAALAAIVGAGLGASGAALQGFTRNDLAGPGILGFSSVAALGAVAALYVGATHLLALAALLGTAGGAALLLALVGRRQGREVLVLAGVGVGALATALTGLMMNFAPNPWALSEIAYWLMGSLANADAAQVGWTATLTALGLALLVRTGPALRVLTLGEEVAQTLGVSLRRTQVLLVAGVALCVGSGVAVAGAIGFVGLFVPHLVRFTLTSDPARLVPLSALAGATVLLLADLAAKGLSGPGTQLYLGILTALVGVPVFLWLAVRSERSGL